MKKILALVLAIMMVFALVACGTSETTSKDESKGTVEVSSITQGADDDVIDFEDLENTSSEEEKTLDLSEPEMKYVVVALKRENIKINSVEDFADYTCAYIGECDSEVWANYYDFKEIGLYNAVNDLHSGLSGNNFKIGIIWEIGLTGYSDWEVVWELKAE